MTRRFLIPAYGADEGAIKKAIGLLQALCQEASPCKALLITSTKQQMDGTGLSEVLGPQVTKALLQRQRYRWQIPVRCNLRLCKRSSYTSVMTWSWQSIGHAKMLKQIDGLLGVEAIIVVPWTPNDTAEWQRVWNPQIIDNELPEGVPASTQDAPAHEALSPVVIEGLKLLSSLVNVSTGISHPLDKPRAVALFRALRSMANLSTPLLLNPGQFITVGRRAALSSWRVLHKQFWTASVFRLPTRRNGGVSSSINCINAPMIVAPHPTKFESSLRRPYLSRHSLRRRC